ncbi:MAG: UDP binding domain-containing protein, partial [Plesiomonas shigelloides]
LIRLANRHPRVNILLPGPGVGGHCIAVDPWFIVAQNPEEARLIRAAREVNDGKPHWVVEKTKLAVAECLTATGKRAQDVKVACLGLAFKPDIDDLRESPAMEITQLIADWHAGQVLAVEPNVHELPKKLHGKVELVSTEQALAQADVLVLLVDHQQFKVILSEQVTQNWVVDTKGVWR